MSTWRDSVDADFARVAEEVASPNGREALARIKLALEANRSHKIERRRNPDPEATESATKE